MAQFVHYINHSSRTLDWCVHMMYGVPLKLQYISLSDTLIMKDIMKWPFKLGFSIHSLPLSTIVNISLLLLFIFNLISHAHFISSEWMRAVCNKWTWRLKLLRWYFMVKKGRTWWLVGTNGGKIGLAGREQWGGRERDGHASGQTRPQHLLCGVRLHREWPTPVILKNHNPLFLNSVMETGAEGLAS